MQTIEKLIEDNMSKFSKGQKKIADYILNNIEKCGYLTAARIARATGVSEATVVRFATALGFSGYPELSRTVREESITKLTAMQRMELVRERMGDKGMLYNVLRADIDRIARTIGIVSEDMFLGAVKALTEAKNVYVAGVRSASALAQFASFYFNVLFKSVRRITNSTAEDVAEQLLHITQGDVVLGISFPRYSNAIVKGLDFAKKRGAKVIALTDSDNSPIVRYADYVLIAKSDMDSFADSLVAPMSIINALIYAVASIKKNELGDVFSELEDIWDEYNVYD